MKTDPATNKDLNDGLQSRWQIYAYMHQNNIILPFPYILIVLKHCPPTLSITWLQELTVCQMSIYHCCTLKQHGLKVQIFLEIIFKYSMFEMVSPWQFANTFVLYKRWSGCDPAAEGSESLLMPASDHYSPPSICNGLALLSMQLFCTSLGPL